MGVKLIDITGKPITGEWGKDDEQGIGIPVLRTTNFTNNGVINYDDVVTRIINKKDLSTKYLQNGDIIIEKSGGSEKQPVGRVVYFDAKENTYLFNNFTGVLRITNKIDWNSKYLFYALFWNYIKGGTRKYQNKTTGLHNLKMEQFINQFEVYNREMKEQQKIAAVLDKVSELITLRKKQLEKLDKLVKSRFVEMFGDPEYNTKNFPVLKLSKLCKVGSSKRIYQNEQSITGIPFLRISNLNDRIDRNIETSELFIPFEKYTKLQEEGLIPVSGDILVTSRGTLGKCYIVKETDNFYFQDGMISWLSEMDESVTSLYITYLFSMSGIQKQIASFQAGSTVAYLSIAMLKKLDIMLPPLEFQNQFAIFVQQVDKQKSSIQQSLEKLEVLKKALMQEYFG